MCLLFLLLGFLLLWLREKCRSVRPCVLDGTYALVCVFRTGVLSGPGHCNTVDAVE